METEKLPNDEHELVIDDKLREEKPVGWKSNIPLNGFLLLALLTVAVFISQYLSDVAGVEEQVAEEVAREAIENTEAVVNGSDILLLDDFNRMVIDSAAVASSVDPSGIWSEEKNQDSWGDAWIISTDTTRSVLMKSAVSSVALVAGEKTWRDLNMRVAFSRPAGASLSVLFRYGDRGDHYSLNIDESIHIDSVVEKRDTLGVDIEVLAQTRYTSSSDSMEVALISIQGDKIRAGLEGSSFVETVDKQLTYGQIGLRADSAVVFHSVEVKSH